MDAPATAPSPPVRTVQPGAPGSTGQLLGASELAAGARHAHTEADVRFMRDMIHHHAQALEMSRLVPERTENPDIRLLARRIDRSQDDEIALMEGWLRSRGEAVPEIPDDHHEHGHADHAAEHDGPHLMSGMLTPEQLEELATARGAEFDRLFLTFMIYHHEGALDMVEDLFATPGAAQDSELFQFASHVDGDQRIEIGRMYRMLQAVR